MVASCDLTADTVLVAHAPVLLESRRADDRRLVDASALVDGVVAAIGFKGPFLGPGFVGCKLWVRLNDIVLDQGVACPAIEGEVAGTSCLVRALVVHSPDGAISILEGEVAYMGVMVILPLATR